MSKTRKRKPRSRMRRSGYRPKQLSLLDHAMVALAFGPKTPEEIGLWLGAEPRKVYAAMSGAGRMFQRWWIKPMAGWNRRACFHLTMAGAKELERRLKGHRVYRGVDPKWRRGCDHGLG